jgi:hypothetical protein
VNLTDLKEALARYGFDSSDPLTTWLNAALHEFEDAMPTNLFEKEATLTLDPGEFSVPLPGDFFQIISFQLDNRPPLQYTELREFQRTYDDLTVTGVPTQYTLVGLDTFRVYPVPDEEETVRLVYVRQASELSDSVPTGVPDIPTRYHYALVQGAAATGLQAENEEDRSQTARGEFDSAIGRAISRLSNKQKHEPDQVQDTAGYTY